MTAYIKETLYYFEVMDEGLVITSFSNGDEPYACIEETRKNGQEDTHMSNTAIFVDGKWKLENEDYNSFEIYHSKKFSDRILNYLTVNGLPTKE